MTYATWPAGLPPITLDGLTVSLSNSIIESPVDRGPPKRRSLSDAMPEPFAGGGVYTRAQWLTLREFYRVTLGGGVLPFEWTDPITQTTAVMQFKADTPPTASPQGHPDRLRVTLTLERMPD